ncbi:MAG: sugar phosphate nucleotidyltransferase [Anaerolineales bacterium]|nr:sugar phosphate nucleotidyltransferase [Anaerolineales bacterium]
MADVIFAVILAGGGGTRLWPVSRRDNPKQALRFLGKQTLFEMTVARVRPLLPLENILVVTADSQVEILRRQAPDLPAEAFVIEPEARGTASAIGLAALVCRQRASESVMACLPSDHFISDPDRFRTLLGEATELASRDELVTFGIPPEYPATGYGYIHRGEPLGSSGAYRVLGFREKPDPAVAAAYLESGDYYWNSGMFVWKARRILGEIEHQMPELHASLERIRAAPGQWKDPSLGSIWSALESETIDYGIMEKAEQVAVLPADGLGWKDIGSWDRLHEVVQADPDGNLDLAVSALLQDCRGTLVYQAEESHRLVAVLGARDLVIVDTPDVVLIVPAAMSERVRELVRELERRGLRQYL